MVKKFNIRKSVPIAELESYMRAWEKRAPSIAKVYSIGMSGGYPIMCAEFTDPTVPACEKEVALIVAQHCGMEITGMTTILSVGNYLSACPEEVQNILRTQIILLVPCPNCYSYEKQSSAYQFKNAAGVDEYAGSFQKTGLELIDPEKTPAAKALKELVDHWMPEFIFDVHGVSYDASILLEFTGGMSFSSLNRTFDRRFVDMIDDAARAEGFDIYSEDELQQQLYTGKLSADPQFQKRFRGGFDAMLLGSYAYIKYHTFALNMEVGFERSGFLRIMKALELGCHGYPVHKIIPNYGMGEPLSAAGINAEKRRESRVALWSQGHRVGYGIIHPEIPGLCGTLTTFSAEAHRRVCAPNFATDLDIFFTNMEQEGFDMSDMREKLQDRYPVSLANTIGNEESFSRTTDCKIGTRIPFADARPTDVWLNGRRLDEDEYICQRSGQATFIHVVIPATQKGDIFFLSVKYRFTPKQQNILVF